MRLIVSGGGTGGHIYPALTIAKTLVEMAQPEAILFVGTTKGLEAELVPKEGFDFSTIEVAGFERRISLANVRNLFRTVGSLWQARKIIADFKPDLVIGTGGYVCGPILLAASLAGIPTLIQEQNVIPGITNKILSRFVRRIAVGYAEATAYFPSKDKVVYTGNPIRRDVMSATKAEGLSGLELDEKKMTLLAAGGSRGARSINTAMQKVHAQFAGHPKIQILHVTGQSEYNSIVGKYKQQGIDVSNTGNSIIKPYLYNMPLALAAADLAIFRAGAIGLAELTARGVPAVLIPYPYAAENHQEYNARVLERHGAATVIRDAELSGELLCEKVGQLLENPDALKAMSEASRRLGQPDAARKICETALNLLGDEVHK